MKKTEDPPKRSISTWEFWRRFGIGIVVGFAGGLAIAGLLWLCGLQGVSQKVFGLIPLVAIAAAWGHAREIKPEKIEEESLKTEQ